MTSELEDVDYAAMADDDLVIDKILVTGTTYYRSNKNSDAAKKLSKIWKILQKNCSVHY